VTQADVSRILRIVVGFGLLLAAGFVAADRSDYATFDAFYSEGTNWSKYLWFATLALASGLVVYFSAGTAIPLVQGIGGWVGTLMGHSGVAATNAGLAFLGGGSIASGGLGMLGGTALLVAALDFTAAVTIDTTVEMVFDRDEFVASMHLRPTLPLPRSAGSTDSAERAMERLGSIDRGRALGPKDIEVVQGAIRILEAGPVDRLNSAELAQNRSLLAILQFISGDPHGAQRSARSAYDAAKRADVKRTLPAALLGITMLYDDHPNFHRSLELFEYSIRYEGGNPIAPTLFAIYFDLLSARADEIPPRYRAWDRLARFVQEMEYDQRKAIFEVLLLSRMIMRVKQEQAYVTVFANSTNCTIWRDPKTLERVEEAWQRYDWLVRAMNVTVESRMRKLRTKVRDDDAKPWESEWLEQLEALSGPIHQYTQDMPRLRGMVGDLRVEQVIMIPRRSGSLCSGPSKA
jgi:hypothetical protein